MTVSAIMVTAVAVAGAQGGAPRHIGMSRQDRWLACAAGVLGKPIFSTWTGPIGPATCQSDRQRFVDAIEQANTGVFDAGEWIVLAPRRFYTVGILFQVPKWKRVQLLPRPSVQEIPGSRALTAEEQMDLARAVLRSARGVPLTFTSQLDQGIPGERPSRPDDETTVHEVFVSLDARRFGQSAESIVSVVTGDRYGAESRVAFGELRGGRFELLWDSPLFWGWRLHVSFGDVNGDGVDEILLASNYGSARNPGVMFSVLTKDGVELTRQSPCVHDGFGLWEQAGSLCPIVGDVIELEHGDGRASDIVVHQGFDGPAFPVRYRLVNGRYRRGARRSR